MRAFFVIRTSRQSVPRCGVAPRDAAPHRPRFGHSSTQHRNGACRGYVIMAMENCGFADQDIRRIMAELYELFDFVSLDEAEAHYQKSPY